MGRINDINPSEIKDLIENDKNIITHTQILDMTNMHSIMKSETLKFCSEFGSKPVRLDLYAKFVTAMFKLDTSIDQWEIYSLFELLISCLQTTKIYKISACAAEIYDIYPHNTKQPISLTTKQYNNILSQMSDNMTIDEFIKIFTKHINIYKLMNVQHGLIIYKEFTRSLLDLFEYDMSNDNPSTKVINDYYNNIDGMCQSITFMIDILKSKGTNVDNPISQLMSTLKRLVYIKTGQ